jgi:hypothetical protein
MSGGQAEQAAWVLRVLGVAVPAGDTAAGDPAALSKTLAALIQRIPEVGAANPGALDGLATLARAARDTLKGPTPGAAGAEIEALRLALEAAGKAQAGEGETAGDEAMPELAGLSARLDAVRERSAALPHPESFTDDILAANAALDRNDAATAGGLIDSLEARLLSAERAQAEAEAIADARAMPGIGVVKLAKLRLQLRALQSSRGLAISQLQASCRDVMTSGDPDDPRLEAGLAALAGIGERVPVPSADLSAAIDEIADTDDKAKQNAGRDKALREIKRYRAALDAEPMLRMLENTPTGSYQIYGHMVESLGALEIALSA